MAKLIKAQTSILIRLSWLTTLVYFLSFAPQKIYSNVFVLALGSGLRAETGTGSEGSSAVSLALSAADDLMRLSGPKPLTNFMNVLPMRMLILLVCSGLSFSSKWEPLASVTCFAYSFYDTILTGWTFVAVRDEINEDNKARVRESRGYVEDTM